MVKQGPRNWGLFQLDLPREGFCCNQQDQEPPRMVRARAWDIVALGATWVWFMLVWSIVSSWALITSIWDMLRVRLVDIERNWPLEWTCWACGIASVFSCVALIGSSWDTAIALLFVGPLDWTWQTVAAWALWIVLCIEFCFLCLMCVWPTGWDWIAPSLAVVRDWAWEWAWGGAGVLAVLILGPTFWSLASGLLWAGWTDLVGLCTDSWEYVIACIVISTAW
jgi:hypothetical protein